MAGTELIVDPNRIGKNSTGIYIRAKYQESWGSYDIYELDKESLIKFLKSRGGDNQWAENVVGVMLGHGNLYTKENKNESSNSG